MKQLHPFHQMGFRLLSTLIVSLSVTACFTEPKYANIPQIDFKTISRYSFQAATGVGQQKRDSLVISMALKMEMAI